MWSRGTALGGRSGRGELLWTDQNPHSLLPCTAQGRGGGSGVGSEGVKLKLGRRGVGGKVFLALCLFLTLF